MQDIAFVQVIQINGSASAIWQAIVDPAIVAKYHLAPLKRMECREGGTIVYGTEETEMISGRIVQWQPGRLLEHTFRFTLPDRAAEADPATTVSYAIAANGAGATLKLTHSGFPEENQTYANICGGWPHILTRLKALLEAGNAE
jgi:uncharacterized protein YndB with AHSA1/START domain